MVQTLENYGFASDLLAGVALEIPVAVQAVDVCST